MFSLEEKLLEPLVSVRGYPPTPPWVGASLGGAGGMVLKLPPERALVLGD